MMDARRLYTKELEDLEDYLSVGQMMLQEMDDTSTGHTAAHARILSSKAEVV